MVLGIGGVPIPSLPQEAVVRTRVEGFTTDPTNPIMVFAVDVDPCTGVTSDRFYAMVFVDQGPPNGAVPGRWRWRPITFQEFLPPTREIRAVSVAGVVTTPSRTDCTRVSTRPELHVHSAGEPCDREPPVPINFRTSRFWRRAPGRTLPNSPKRLASCRRGRGVRDCPSCVARMEQHSARRS
jgi:hypothetical protein